MGTSTRRLPQERRAADRPVNGDTRPCPHCGGTLEFSERYRLGGRPQPAWICDRANCPMSKPARRKRGLVFTGRELVRLATELPDRARRTFMKSVARRDRSLERIE
jgi:hypothetical protein